MFLSKITVKNFRLLKDFSIDLEHELSLIIGKNNSGKTSLLYLLDKIFHWRDKGGCIHIDDFNLDYKKSLVDMLIKDEAIDEKEYPEDGVRLRLYIKYNNDDDLSNVGLIMMDLDENNYLTINQENLPNHSHGSLSSDQKFLTSAYLTEGGSGISGTFYSATEGKKIKVETTSRTLDISDSKSTFNNTPIKVEPNAYSLIFIMKYKDLD